MKNAPTPSLSPFASDDCEIFSEQKYAVKNEQSLDDSKLVPGVPRKRVSKHYSL